MDLSDTGVRLAWVRMVIRGGGDKVTRPPRVGGGTKRGSLVLRNPSSPASRKHRDSAAAHCDSRGNRRAPTHRRPGWEQYRESWQVCLRCWYWLWPGYCCPAI